MILIDVARANYAGMLERAFSTPGGVLQARLTSKRADRTTGARVGYARFELRRGRDTILAIGVSAYEDQQTIDGIIAAAIVWLAAFNLHRRDDGRTCLLWLLLPRGLAQTAIERLTLITTAHLGARIECYEVDETDGYIRSLPIASQTELVLSSSLKHASSVSWAPIWLTRSISSGVGPYAKRFNTFALTTAFELLGTISTL